MQQIKCARMKRKRRRKKWKISGKRSCRERERKMRMRLRVYPEPGEVGARFYALEKVENTGKQARLLTMLTVRMVAIAIAMDKQFDGH